MSQSMFPPGYEASGSSGAFFPAIAPPFPYALPTDPFNKIIGAFGENLGWCKSHTCACVNFRTDMSPVGSPNPSCLTCQGRGIYWDAQINFIGLMTLTHQGAGGVEPGQRMDEKLGPIIGGEPWVTITSDAGVVWNEVGEYDIMIQTNSIVRMNSTLNSGPSGEIYLPYQQGLYVAPSGAVTTWDPMTSQVTPVTGYYVSGATVTIPPTYTPNTPYVVEFQAALSYVCFRPEGGMAQNRPFIQGTVSFPKRFRLEPLDLWMRDGVQNNWGTPGQISLIPPS